MLMMLSSLCFKECTRILQLLSATCGNLTGVLRGWMAADLATVKRIAASVPDRSPLTPLTWQLGGVPGMSITATPLAHRLPCWGYVFQVTTLWKRACTGASALTCGMAPSWCCSGINAVTAVHELLAKLGQCVCRNSTHTPQQ